MLVPENRLFCRLDGLSQAARDQNRSDALLDLRLLESDSVPVFEEVVQASAHVAQVPVAWLSFADRGNEYLKATFGLSRLGLMNELVVQRSIDQRDSFGIYVVDSHQPLAITDTLAHPAFAQSLLTQQYGIRAYLGVPLMTSKGEYIGVLSVLDTVPREFTVSQIEFLMLTARLAMSDYERSYYQRQAQELARSAQQVTVQDLLQAQIEFAQKSNLAVMTSIAGTIDETSIPLKYELLAQLAQELRTPLTSVMGMASVLTREIYGPLTLKQREYLDIIHHSGEYLLSLVKEILELSQLDLNEQEVHPVSVDIEMLCQQAITTLEQAAHRREQQIRLTVEPGNRIWMLDKEKIRQMLYHLIFSVIQSSNAGSNVHLHVSNKIGALRLTIWVTHPCLEDTLFSGKYASEHDRNHPLLNDRLLNDRTFSSETSVNASINIVSNTSSNTALLDAPNLDALSSPEVGIHEALQQNLGFLLSRQLVELHGGQIQVQGESGLGYRYVITIPRHQSAQLDS
jgi:signal transduction histidine kinase